MREEPLAGDSPPLPLACELAPGRGHHLQPRLPFELTFRLCRLSVPSVFHPTGSRGLTGDVSWVPKGPGTKGQLGGCPRHGRPCMPGLGAYGGLGGKLSGPDGETARCPGPRVSPAPMSPDSSWQPCKSRTLGTHFTDEETETCPRPPSQSSSSGILSFQKGKPCGVTSLLRAFP